VAEQRLHGCGSGAGLGLLLADELSILDNPRRKIADLVVDGACSISAIILLEDKRAIWLGREGWGRSKGQSGCESRKREFLH
jgi:hypothetical protein